MFTRDKVDALSSSLTLYVTFSAVVHLVKCRGDALHCKKETWAGGPGCDHLERYDLPKEVTCFSYEKLFSPSPQEWDSTHYWVKNHHPHAIKGCWWWLLGTPLENHSTIPESLCSRETSCLPSSLPTHPASSGERAEISLYLFSFKKLALEEHTSHCVKAAPEAELYTHCQSLSQGTVSLPVPYCGSWLHSLGFSFYL